MNADLAGILDIYFHEDHPERILFAGPAYYHWVTSDYGHTFTKVCCHSSRPSHLFYNTY